MSKKMLAEEREARLAARTAAGPSTDTDSSATGGGGVFANMAKQIQERTEKLNIMGDSMDKLGESSASFADDVSKFVEQQKRRALFGGKLLPPFPHWRVLV